MSNDHKKSLKLTVVVSGTGVEVEAHTTEELSKVAEKAIKEASSKEKDLSKWSLTNSDKTELGFNQTVEDAGIKDGDTLYLNLKAGVTG